MPPQRRPATRGPRLAAPARRDRRRAAGRGAHRAGWSIPTLVPALEAAGYDRTRRAPELAARRGARRRARPQAARRPTQGARWQRVTVDRPRDHAARPASRLDTGGTGKGLAADMLATATRHRPLGASTCGGDLRVCGALRRRGPPPAHRRDGPHARGSATARSPRPASTRGCGARPTARRAITCSTRAPAEPAWTGLISVTALAPTALEAETLAKAALLSGPNHARPLAHPPRRPAIHDDGDVEHGFADEPGTTHTWWLMSRSAGVVALVLVAISVLIGLTLAAGLAGPPARRGALVAFHEQTANAAPARDRACTASTLLGDGFLKPGHHRAS